MGKKKNNSLREKQAGHTSYGVPDDIAKLRKELITPVKDNKRSYESKNKKSRTFSSNNSSDNFNRSSIDKKRYSRDKD